jgi:hypothetical protein
VLSFLTRKKRNREERQREEYRTILRSYLIDPDVNIFGITEDDLTDPNTIHCIPKFTDFALLTDFSHQRLGRPVIPNIRTEPRLPESDASPFHLLNDRLFSQDIYLITRQLADELASFSTSTDKYFNDFMKNPLFQFIKEDYLKHYAAIIKPAMPSSNDNVIVPRSQVIVRDGRKCILCGQDSQELHVHHHVYRAHGGKDTLGNMMTLCKLCHGSLFNHDLVHKRGSRPVYTGDHSMDNAKAILQHLVSTAPEVMSQTLQRNVLHGHPLISRFGLRHYGDHRNLCRMTINIIFSFELET